MGGEINPMTGLVGDPTPPYGPYLSNFNHVTENGNPFEYPAFAGQWYEPPHHACSN